MTPWLNGAAGGRSIIISSPRTGLRSNESGDAQERVSLIAGRSADHLIVGRIADRRRWLGAPLARGDSARVRPTPRGRYR